MDKTGPQEVAKLLVTVETAAEMLSLHRSRLFPLMASGRLRSLKIGKSRRLAVSELQRFIAEEMATQCGEQSPLS